MLTRPRPKSCYRVERVDAACVVLMAEGRHVLLRGQLYARVLPLLDGQLTTDEVIQRLEGQASAAEILYVLELLERKGYLVEASTELPQEAAAFWHSLGLDVGDTARRLREASLALHSLGQASLEPLRRALASLGLREGPPGDLTVVVTDDYLHPRLEELNRQALATRRPWLLVKLVGVVALLGPLFRPRDTGCWECLAQRLRGTRAVETTLRRDHPSRELPGVPHASLPVGIQAAAELSALEIARWIAQGKNARLEGRVLSLELGWLGLEEHELVKRPQCPACGEERDRAPREPAPLVLQRRSKGFSADGGHREVSPEQTFATYARHVSPLTGAVRGLHGFSRPEYPWLQLWDSGPNLALRSDELALLPAWFRSRSGGKGKTEAQAKAGALCEALERYCGVFQGDEPRRRARMAELGAAAIHPNACMGYSAAQYARRHEWNQRRTFHEHVPEPFDASVELDWSPVWSLTRNERRYVPAAYCYYDYPQPPAERFCFADSNGSAAGNSLEEAILQGFLELVERESASLWWYNRLARPRVELSSFDDPYLQSIESFHGSLDRSVWVLDLTAELAIPAFVAVSRRREGPREQLLFGFGAHLDARLGVLRAVTELNQFLASLLLPRGTEQLDPSTRGWLEQATLANQPYLDFDRSAAPKRAADYPRLASDDLAEDVRSCVATAERHGLETLVIDQTRPDIGLPVVKVIIPGMRHFWRRLGPGRLYEVPVRMGWLPAPLTEEQLNPLTIFF